MKVCHGKQYYPALVLVILLSWSCGQHKNTTKPIAPKDYAVLVVQPRSATTYTDFPATIQGENIVEIRPMVDGYLEAIYVQEGAMVKKGQLLFRIKNPQYEQAVISAAAAIKIAEADVNAAKMDVEKVRPLVQKEIVNKYQLESAQYTLQSKEAALAQANAALANAQTNLGYTILRSPQSGVISSIPYKIGALVSSTSSQPLTTLSNIGNVYAYFSLNEKQLLTLLNNVQHLSLQDRLSKLPPATLLLADGTEYGAKGILEAASGFISTETGAASLKATFPNPMGIIRSGASGTVRIPRQNDTALMVPQAASYQIQNKQFVYTVGAGNLVFSRAITSTATNNGQFLIVRSGLLPGDKVVVNGINLKDSTVIRPVIINADSLYNQPQ